MRLSTLDRLAPALAGYLIIAWRIQYLTVLGRTTPDLPCDAVLDPTEWQAIYVAIHRCTPPLISPPLPAMLGWIAARRSPDFLAPTRFSGTTDAALVNAWLRHLLCKEPRPHSTLISDHAAFHKKKDLEAIA